LRERGHAAGICRDQPPIITVPRSPSKLIEKTRGLLRVTSGRAATVTRHAGAFAFAEKSKLIDLSSLKES
jgi:hypothetical protein